MGANTYLDCNRYCPDCPFYNDCDYDIKTIKEENMEKRIDIKVFVDGNQVCVLYGEDLQVGVAGFGDTISEALLSFSKDWKKQRKVFLTELKEVIELKEVKKVPVIDREFVRQSLWSYWERIGHNGAFVDDDFIESLFDKTE